MFNTLHARLLLSYAFILVLTLTVIGVALLLVLSARPVPTEEISQRLASALLTVQDRRELAEIPPSGPNLRQIRILNVLARQARLRNLPLRILVVRADQTVGFDSLRVFRPGERISFEFQPYAPPDVLSDEAWRYPVPAMVRGSFLNPDGSDWRFVAQAPDSSNPDRWLYMLALRGPGQLSFAEMVQYYGEDVLIPLLQAGLIGLVTAFALALIVARSVARPLQQVAQSAETVARGQLYHRAPVRGPREVRIVAEAFNTMTQEVAATQQAQRDFMANVTHDLRTPLTSIQGFSQAIIDGVASDPEAAQRAAHIIHDEAGRLNRMVEELLDLARIEAGRWTMTRHTVHLDEILRSVGERLAPKLTKHGLALDTHVPQLSPIAGDGDRLVQVFTNLIDNAMKHTPPGGRVTLRAASQDGGILVQVCDTGEGIPAADVPRIFDRFYQVDKSRQRSPREGAGLGLTITRQIVEAHGGKIWAESEEGVGTTISAWFPAPAPDATTIIRRRTGVFRRAPEKGDGAS